MFHFPIRSRSLFIKKFPQKTLSHSYSVARAFLTYSIHQTITTVETKLFKLDPLSIYKKLQHAIFLS